MNIIYSIIILLFGLFIFYFYWLRKERRENQKNLFEKQNYDFEVSNELALTAKNPDTAYAYWSSDKLKTKEEKLVFKLYDITTEKKVKLSFIVNSKQEELFIQLPDSNHFYYAKLGFYDKNNKFIPLAVSETIAPPPTTFSKKSSGVWLELQEDKNIYSYEDYNYLSKDDLATVSSSDSFNRHNK